MYEIAELPIPFWVLIFGGWGILFKKCAYKLIIDLDSKKIILKTYTSS